MYNVIFLVIILLCFAGVIFIVSRKFPQLTNLDVENLPEELEAKKKKELLSKRLAEKARRMRVIWSKRLWPLVKIWGVLQLKFRIYVGKVERLWHHEQTLKNKQKRKSTASTANARVAAESLAQQ